MEDLFAAACDLPENLILYNTGEYVNYEYLDPDDSLIWELLDSDRKQVRKAVQYFVEALEEHDDGEFADGINAFLRSWRHALRI